MSTHVRSSKHLLTDENDKTNCINQDQTAPVPINLWDKELKKIFVLFCCFTPSQHFFSYVGMEPVLSS